MPANESGSQPVPAVKNLKSALQYQEGAVVSRVLLKNPGGTVTLFAFGKGEGLSEHATPFDALVICVEGDAEILISGQKYIVQEGQTITLPANQPHAIRATRDFKMLLVMLKA